MGQELIQHDKLGSGFIHKVTDWRFQDTASRLDIANQFVAADIDKMCYDMETGKYYLLKDVHPSSGVPTWYEVSEAVGSGEANTASSVGGGATLVKGKVGVDLQFKSLVQGANVLLTADANTVTISAVLPATPPADETLIAAAPIGGHRVVSRVSDTEVAHTNYFSYNSCRGIVGISLGAASLGAPVTVRKDGLLIEPSWSWTPDQDIYLTFSGQLTQTIPAAEHLICVGVAITATSMQIRLSPIIKLL
jgi:hypothetical protein